MPVLHVNHCSGPATFVALFQVFEGQVFHGSDTTTLELESLDEK